MKINFQHNALSYYNPINGQYDESEQTNEDGFLEVEGKYEVCSTCNGHGSHFRSDLDENNLVDNMREDCDEEGIEAYYNGSFDQICEECNGQRVVFSPILPEWARELIWNYNYNVGEHNAIRDSERRMGA